MGAVYKKELTSFFTTMTGYVFIAFILVIVGIFMTSLNLKGGYPDFEHNLGSVSFTFLFLIPILTMRSFSEERHSRTDQLLYSLPLSVKDIVLGKYFAMLSVFAIPCAVMCLYPLILSMYGTVFFIRTYSAILAFFLLGSALIAIGMFMSSLTESQVISAVVCFGAVLVCYLMSGIAGLIPATALATFISFTVINLLLCALIWYMTKNTIIAYSFAFGIEAVILIVYMTNRVLFEGLINKVLSAVSLFERLSNFIYGMFDLTSILYYLSVMVIFVFFTCQAVEKRRWS